MDFIDKHKEYIAKEKDFLSRIKGDYTDADLDVLQEKLDTMRLRRTNESKGEVGQFYANARRTVGRAILAGEFPEPERKSFLGSPNLY